MTHVRVFALVLIAALVAGCQSPPTPEETPPLSVTPIMTITPTATDSPMPTATATPTDSHLSGICVEGDTLAGLTVDAVYSRNTSMSGEEQGGVFLLNVENDSVIKVTWCDGAVHDTSLQSGAWSPEGDVFVFTDVSDAKPWEKNVYLMNPSTGEIRWLFAYATHDLWPPSDPNFNYLAWSPDGSRIAFGGVDADSLDDRAYSDGYLGIYSLADQTITRVYETPEGEAVQVDAVGWTSDSQLIFASGITFPRIRDLYESGFNKVVLYHLDVETGETTELYRPELGIGDPVFSASQPQIMVMLVNEYYWSGPVDWNAQLIDLDSGAQELLFDRTVVVYTPRYAFSPDGTALAYLPDLNNLCIRELADGGTICMPFDPELGWINTFSWLPDSQSIAIQHYRPEDIGTECQDMLVFSRDLNYEGAIILHHEGVDSSSDSACFIEVISWNPGYLWAGMP